MTADNMEFAPSRRLPLRRPPYDEQTLRNIENTAFKGLSPLNLRLALAHHPKLGEKFQAIAQTVLFEAEIEMRPKELAIMRTCALAGNEYAWGMHVAIYGERVGLDEAAVDDLTLAPSWRELTDPRWSESDRLAIRVADELHRDANVEDETWARLNETWPTGEVIELIFSAGVYRLASCFINSTAVPLETGQARFPDGYRRA